MHQLNNPSTVAKLFCVCVCLFVCFLFVFLVLFFVECVIFVAIKSDM